MFIVWFFGESQVLMLERDPVGGEVAVEEVIPANVLLEMVEQEILAGEHVRGVMGMSRVEEKKEGMADQGAQRGVYMPLGVKARETLHNVGDKSESGKSGASQKVVVILVGVVTRWTVR